MAVEAITFDVGGTLIECWPSVGHIYAEVAANSGHPGLSATELTECFINVWGETTDFNYTRNAWVNLVDQVFEGLVSPPPSQTFFDALYRRFDQPSAWKIYDDVLPALEALQKRGLKLAVISNWDDRLRPLLDRLKLSGFFECRAVSVEVGRVKPATEIFNVAAQLLGVSKSRILHIGDSRNEDVAGAEAAGLQALLLDRRSNSTISAGVISNLTQLLEHPCILNAAVKQPKQD